MKRFIKSLFGMVNYEIVSYDHRWGYADHIRSEYGLSYSRLVLHHPFGGYMYGDAICP